MAPFKALHYLRVCRTVCWGMLNVLRLQPTFKKKISSCNKGGDVAHQSASHPWVELCLVHRPVDYGFAIVLLAKKTPCHKPQRTSGWWSIIFLHKLRSSFSAHIFWHGGIKHKMPNRKHDIRKITPECPGLTSSKIHLRFASLKWMQEIFHHVSSLPRLLVANGNNSLLYSYYGWRWLVVSNKHASEWEWCHPQQNKHISKISFWTLLAALSYTALQDPDLILVAAKRQFFQGPQWKESFCRWLHRIQI